MKRKKNQLKLEKRFKSDQYWDDLADPSTADIIKATKDWKEGAEQLDELLETPAAVDDIEDGENA